MELDRLKNIIIHSLAHLSTEVKLRGVLHLFDINTLCEQLYCTILNTVYGWSLENANTR